jgi:hypothetical protein
MVVGRTFEHPALVGMENDLAVVTEDSVPDYSLGLRRCLTRYPDSICACGQYDLEWE